MAPRTILRHDRTIKVLFCLISICLGVNSPHLHNNNNNNNANDKETKDINIETQYGNNLHDKDIDRSDYRKKYKFLYDKDLNDWNGFFTNRKLFDNIVERKSENKVKLKNNISGSKSEHLEFEIKGQCNRQSKRKHLKRGPIYDLHQRLEDEWEQNKNKGFTSSCEENNQKEVCIDGCNINTEYKPPELPENCTRTTEDGVVDITCTNITKVPFFKDRHIESLCFENTNIRSFDSKDSCNLPRGVNTLVFDTSPLTNFDGSNIHCKCLERIFLVKSEIKCWSFTFFSVKEASIRFMSLRSNMISYGPHTPRTSSGQPPQVISNNTSGQKSWCETGEEKYEVSSSEPRMPLLETLILSDNHLNNLPAMLFYPIRNSPVKNLLLKNCSLKSFSMFSAMSPFNYTQNLEALDLSDNVLFSKRNLANLLQPLATRNLFILHITGNKYTSPPIEALQTVSSSLKEVFLNHSAFDRLDETSFPSMPKLEHLAIGHSRINMICAGTFDGLPSLKRLYLEGNKLTTISPAVLVPSLQILNFDDQRYEDGGVFTLDTVDFHEARELKSLSLNNIPVMEIKENTFLGLHNLITLELNGAQISSIAKESFRSMKKLKELYINENYIENIPPDTFKDLNELEYLEIQSNCLSFITFPLISPEISSQLQLGGTTPLVAWFKGIKRSLMAESKAQVDAFDRNNIPYSSPFSQQVNLKYIDMSHNNIRYLFEDLFVDLNSLTYLNLNHNDIDEWDDSLFENSKNFSKFYLYGNKISSLTEGMQNSFNNIMDVIDLQDNDFDCDCSLEYLNDSRFYRYDEYICRSESINSGTPYKKIIDYLNENMCDDTPMTETTVTESSKNQGPPPKTIVIPIVASLVAILSLVILAVTGYRKRWYALYMMHKLRNHSREYQEQVQSNKYIYDTFVCYASSDRQWIFEQLLPKLEDKERLVVCVHERDFTVGQGITDNIVDSIDRSRKVIVVLSPAFVQSSWCMFELKIANCATIKARQSKLIFIILEHIQEELMPKTLGVLLKTRTYIPWFLDIDSQKLFWARIKRAVAKPSESEMQVNYTKL